MLQYLLFALLKDKYGATFKQTKNYHTIHIKSILKSIYIASKEVQYLFIFVYLYI